MSSLRTALTQTCNSNASVCPIMSTLATSFSSFLHNQDSRSVSSQTNYIKGSQSMRLGSCWQGSHKK